jgi:cyanophycinase
MTSEKDSPGSANRKAEKARRECPAPKGKLLAIGGKESKGERPHPDAAQEQNGNYSQLQVLERFRDELSGNDPLVALIPTPSQEPEEMIRTYREAFGKLGLSRIEVVDVRNRQDTFNRDYYQILEQAQGVMITGGDQLRLTSLLGGTPLLELLKTRYTHEEILIAGTSAGAAALSTPMIYTGQSDGGFKKGDVYITTGLEFVRDVAIDTHFIARGRFYRMAQAIATNPQCMGIGLEEDTAILVREGKYLEVVGSGLITVLDGKGLLHSNVHLVESGTPVTLQGLRVLLLGKGDCYTLPTQDQLHQ